MSGNDVAKIMDAAKGVTEDIVYRTMAIAGTAEVKERIDELLRVGVRDFAVTDLLAPRTVRRTLDIFRKIIRGYR